MLVLLEERLNLIIVMYAIMTKQTTVYKIVLKYGVVMLLKMNVAFVMAQVYLKTTVTVMAIY